MSEAGNIVTGNTVERRKWQTICTRRIITRCLFGKTWSRSNGLQLRPLKKKLDVPVVLLLDPTDASARAIADASGMSAKIDEWIANNSGRGVVTCLTWFIPGMLAYKLLRTQFPGIREFQSLPERMFHTVVVSQGGVTTGESTLP